MPKPFYTVPSVAVLREEVERIVTAHQRGDEGVVETLQHLPAFAEKPAAAVHAARVTRPDVRQALASMYVCEDWASLIFSAETLEADNWAQINNRAKFLRDDHAAGKKIAAERLRKAFTQFANLPDAAIFVRKVTLRETRRVIAREYGFEHWAQLERHVQAATEARGFLAAVGALPPAVDALLQAVDAGDANRAAALLGANPCLVHARVSSDINCGDTLLHRADPRATNGRPMTNGHLKVAQLLIDNGIDINAMGGCGDSCFTPPIDASVWIGNKPMVRLLLKNGADPNLRYWDMPYPVHTAANHNGRESFKLLIEAGAHYTLHETIKLGLHKLTRELLLADPASVDKRSRDGMPLCLAASNIRLLRLLLRHGADVNVRDPFGYTPLMRAIEADEAQAVAELLRRDVELDIFGAIGVGDSAAVAKLLRENPNAVQPQHGQLPLIWAVRTGDWALVEQLLANGADVNATQEGGWNANTALTTAMTRKYDDFVQPLIDAGADVNPNTGPWTIPLVGALRWGTHRTVQTLLDAGADPNAQNAGFSTPLDWSAYIGDLRGALQLIDAGANPSALTRALRTAAQNAQAGVFELLAANGGNAAAPHAEGTTLQRAERRGDAVTIALVREWLEIRAMPKTRRERAMKSRATFMRAVLEDDAKTLRRLLRSQPALAQREVVRDHAFHWAAGIRQPHSDRATLPAAVEALVEFGVPWTVWAAAACGRVPELRALLPYEGPEGGAAALHAAAKMDRVDVLTFLLDEGATVDVRQRRGTALHEAVRFISYDAAELLLASGANPNAPDQHGNTPLQLNGAGSRERAALRELLLAHGARR